MKLEQLIAEERCDLKDDEFCTAGDDDDSVEADLLTSLEFLEQCLMAMESILVRGKRITRLPKGFQELMEEVSDHLEQWQGYSPVDRAEKR